MPTRQCELQPAVDVEEPARAVTHKDIADLSRAGIGEAVLIELIEMDDIAHPLARPRLRVSVLKILKRAGVSDQVLLALLRSERSAAGHRRGAARRTRRSEGESSGRLPLEGARNARASDHVERAGARAHANPAGASNTRPGGRPRHDMPSSSRGERSQLPVDDRSNRDDPHPDHHTSRADVMRLVRQKAGRLPERAKRDER